MRRDTLPAPAVPGHVEPRRTFRGHCRYCGSKELARSRYRGLEYLLPLLLLRPYRCMACTRRCWRRLGK